MKIAAFCLCWLLILTAPGVMAQQSATPHQSWDLLRQLQPGEKVRVQRKTASKKFTGKLVSASDMELVIERKKKNVSFGRDEVKKVWRIIPSSGHDKLKSTSIGISAGAAVGLVTVLLIGLVSCQDGCGEAEFYVPFFGIVAASGLLGYFMERGYHILIYSAP
jgi:hypothetical protein